MLDRICHTFYTINRSSSSSAAAATAVACPNQFQWYFNNNKHHHHHQQQQQHQYICLHPRPLYFFILDKNIENIDLYATTNTCFLSERIARAYSSFDIFIFILIELWRFVDISDKGHVSDRFVSHIPPTSFITSQTNLL